MLATIKPKKTTDFYRRRENKLLLRRLTTDRINQLPATEPGIFMWLFVRLFAHRCVLFFLVSTCCYIEHAHSQSSNQSSEVLTKKAVQEAGQKAKDIGFDLLSKRKQKDAAEAEKQAAEKEEKKKYFENRKRQREFNYSAPRLQINAFLLEGLGDQTESNNTRRDVEKIVADLHAGFSPDGYDIDALRTITDAITQYYRKKGYFLASAYIPEQTITDGLVTLQILLGTLANVIPENNTLYKKKQLIKPFKSYFGKPVNRKEIESAVLLINDYPGLEASAVFAPGEELGTTALTINTTKETPRESFLGFDNYGNEFTGRYRLRGSFIVNNLFGLADKLSFSTVQTFAPTNSTYGTVDFSLPIWKSGLRLGIAYSNNAYAVGDVFEDLGIAGTSSLIDLHGRYSIKRGRDSNIFTRFGLLSKSASSKGGGVGLETSDELTVFYTGIGFDGNDHFFGGRHFGELTINQGLIEKEEAVDVASFTPVTDGMFTKLNLNYTHSFPFEKANNQYLLLNTRMQFSGNVLSSLEQMPLGGPQSVRAYSVSKYQVDSGSVFNLEWVVRTMPSDELEWTKNVQLSAYIDYAMGTLNSSDQNNRTLFGNESSVTLKGIGGGIRLTPAAGYQLRFDLAIPIGKPEPNDDSSVRFLMNLGYVF